MDVNFYQLIVIAPIFIKYLLNIQYTMAAAISYLVLSLFLVRNIQYSTHCIYPMYSAYIENLEITLETKQ